MAFRRKGTYATAAVLVVLVVAALLFTGSAWSQDKNGDSKNDRKESRQEKRTQKSETRTQTSTTQSAESPGARLADQNPSAREALQAVDQVEASQDLDGVEDVVVDGDPIERIAIDVNNCDVDLGDSITFGVVGGPDEDDIDFATVIDGVNADIGVLDNGDTIGVEDTDGSGAIEFFVERNGNFGTTFLREDDELVVETSTIDCGNNNNNRRDRNDRFRDRVNDVLEDEGLIDEDDDGDIDQDDEVLDAENDLNGEGTDGELTDGQYDDEGNDDSPVSANADENGAEASTPGAVASAGGDPDELQPLRSTPDDVVDEVPTSGPLPNTGGAPLWVYVLPALGSLMLLVAVMRRFRGTG